MLRDGFTCRYCGGKTIPTPIMELLSGFYPQEFPYHRNWKAGLTHPAVIVRSTVIDHLDPRAWGGEWIAEGNLVTACWPCNVRKGDLSLKQLGWKLMPIARDDWDGLTRYWRPMWERAGRINPAKHNAWLRAFGL
jgi:HNH endonuclease